MEFPELGEHCCQENCHQLDFLPVKCDGCEKKFCGHHWKYEAHGCPNGHIKNAQVPICPLCDQPVPSSRSQLPDIAVSAHIDRDCKSDPAVKKRSKCSVGKCKQKEFVKIICEGCGLNFCLRHRHKEDHKCRGQVSMNTNNTSRSGLAALERFQHSKLIFQTKTPKDRTFTTSSPSFNLSAFQGALSEEDAFKKVLLQSIQEAESGKSSSVEMSQEEQDRQLAEAIAKSEQEFHLQSRPEILATGSDEKLCLLQ